MNRSVARAAGRPSITDSLEEYGRGLAGGLIFSVPLLYTMEVWWTGQSASPVRLVSAFSATFLLLLGYNRFAGLHVDATWKEVAIDSVEELGLGLLLSSLILLVLGRIDATMAPGEILGKIILESICVAIGVSIGTAQLGGGGDRGGMQARKEPQDNATSAALSRLGSESTLALCGAVVVAGNVAPTEEIQMIGAEADPWRIVALAIVSLLACALIQFYSGFSGSGRYSKLVAIDMILSVALSYAVALLASAALLWLFDRLQGMSLRMNLSQIVVLGMPASLGAAAGRLLLGSGNDNDEDQK